jgi:hypothetical protein
MDFRVVVNYHDEVLRIDQPGWRITRTSETTSRFVVSAPAQTNPGLLPRAFPGS